MLKRKYKYVYVNTENKFIIFYLQGAQDSGISEIPGIIMGFFFSQGISEKSGNVVEFFHQGLSSF